jgi:hypothetical protein
MYTKAAAVVRLALPPLLLQGLLLLGRTPWLRLPEPAAWDSTPADRLLWSALLLVSLGVCWWLTATSLVYLYLVARRSTRAALVGRWTAPFLRKAADRMVATGLSLALFGPAVARADDRPWVPEPVARVAPMPTPAVDPSPRVVVVQPGDNFWRIAESVVGDHDPEALARYWVKVVEANRDRIRSGDPNLIYPGEQIVLPDP